MLPSGISLEWSKLLFYQLITVLLGHELSLFKGSIKSNILVVLRLIVQQEMFFLSLRSQFEASLETSILGLEERRNMF